MEIANLKIVLRKFGRAAPGIAAMCALQAMAQQQVPAQMQKPDTSAWKQNVPGIATQNLPGSPPAPVIVPGTRLQGAQVAAPYDFDDCSLGEVSAVELQAVRASILAALGSNSAGIASFTNAEKKIPASCTRKRAAYYLRAIAQIQAAK